MAYNVHCDYIIGIYMYVHAKNDVYKYHVEFLMHHKHTCTCVYMYV